MEPLGAGGLDFTRLGDGVCCVTNLSARAHPVAGTVALASAPLVGNRLPPDSSAWLAY